MNPHTGDLLSITAPLNWHTDSQSTYNLITDKAQLETFFKWGGTVDPTTFFWDQTPQKQAVALGQPTLIYSFQSICSQENDYSSCGTYLIPSLSAEVIDEELSFMSEIIIPLSTNQP
jgi:hypothetical protein